MVNNMKKRIFLVVVLLFMTLGLYLLYSYSFISIILPISNSDSELTISKNSKAVSVINAKPGLNRQLVKRGTYEVVVKSSQGSYFEITNAPGFLRTTNVKASLTKERQRIFIGNNPAPCVYKFKDVFISSVCGGLLDEANIHQAATSTTPTFTKALTGPSGILEDVFTVDGQTYALLLIESEIDEEGSYHAMYPLDNSGNIDGAKEKRLRELSGSSEYKFIRYNNGYLAYSLSPLDMHFYSDMNSPPSKINTPKPSKDLQAISVDVSNDRVAVLFSNYFFRNVNRPERIAGNAHSLIVENKRPTAGSSIHSEIVVTDLMKEVARKELSGEIGGMSFCGNNKLCTITNENAELISMNIADNLDEDKKISNTSGLGTLGGRTIVVRNDGVYEIDIETGTGYLHYSFGNYSYCGLEVFDDIYTLCIANNESKSNLLKFNLEQPEKEFIDQKLADLEANTAVKNLSIYGNYIYISPITGEPQYNEQLGGFEYDPILVQDSKNKINEVLDRLRINRSIFDIKFTVN